MCCAPFRKSDQNIPLFIWKSFLKGSVNLEDYKVSNCMLINKQQTGKGVEKDFRCLIEGAIQVLGNSPTKQTNNIPFNSE